MILYDIITIEAEDIVFQAPVFVRPGSGEGKRIHPVMEEGSKALRSSLRVPQSQVRDNLGYST